MLEESLRTYTVIGTERRLPAKEAPIGFKTFVPLAINLSFNISRSMAIYFYAS